MSNTKAKAPAKIILCGEHAALYGVPALVMAINRFAVTEIMESTQSSSNDTITFAFPALQLCKTVRVSELAFWQTTISQRYQQFLRGSLPVSALLQSLEELPFYIFAYLKNEFSLNISSSLTISFSTDIPLGSGLGSSAAFSVSMISAIKKFFKLDFSSERFLQLGIEMEKLCHGKTGGMDVYAALHGGFFCFQLNNGSFTAVSRPMPKFNFYLVNTGRPKSGTGECIVQAEHFFKDTSLLQEFAGVVKACDLALSEQNFADLSAAIFANEKLLEYIQVVPEKVRHFIAMLAKEKIAAKISGAGAVRGDNAGVVLVLPKEEQLESLRDLVAGYGYELLPHAFLHVRENIII